MSESEKNQIELNIALQQQIYIYEDLVENLQGTVDKQTELEKLYIKKEKILNDYISELQCFMKSQDQKDEY